GALRGVPAGDCESSEEDGPSIQGAQPCRSSEWQVQGRVGEHDLSSDGRKGPLQDVRNDRKSLSPSQGRKSPEQYADEFGSALHVVPHTAPQAGLVGCSEICLI